MRPMRLVPAVVLVGGASLAHADPVRSLDVSGYAGVADYGSNIELGNSWASEQVPGAGVLVGGRCGITLLPDLAPRSSVDPQLGVEGELDMSMSSTGESMQFARRSFFAPVFGWRAHVIARLRTHGAIDPHLVVGVGGESVVSSSPFMSDDTDAAFHWGVGFTWHASPGWLARLDLRQELTAGRTSTVTAAYELQLGLEKSFELGPTSRPAPLSHVEPLPPPPPPDPDRDHDGIVNEKDDCPDVAEDRDGFQDDDGCPDPDNDGDGVVDANDKCPEQAEDHDGFQDDDGCPDPDNDGDGIPDANDRCPNQAEIFNGYQDADGCPDDLPVEIGKYVGVVKGVTFANGKARLSAADKRVLDGLADVLRKYPDVRIEISGHQTPLKTDAAARAFDLRRAEAVKWYLVDQGIVADQVLTVTGDDNLAMGVTQRGNWIQIELSSDAPAPVAPASQP